MRKKNCFFLFSKDFQKVTLIIFRYQTYSFRKILCNEAVENLFKCYISINQKTYVDYKKKSLNKLSSDASYEEIDTRLASGWYVDSVDNNKKKKYRTKKVTFKISKKI